jgi:hypothetical protein
VVPLTATPIRAAHDVTLHVSFSLHTFTRGLDPDDPLECHYRDSREIRAFDPVRYHHSLLLPQVMRTLQHRRCEFAKDKNGVISYVTIELDNGAQYAAFFDLQRRAKLGPFSLDLYCKSAYTLDPGKPRPGRGRITLRAMIGHALRGTRPHPPPR